MSRHLFGPTRPCPILGCPTQIRLNTVACRKHWLQIPQALRGEITTAWTEVQLGRAGARERYQAARKAAIEAVEAAEGVLT